MNKIIITILSLLSLNCNAEWEQWSDFDKKLFMASELAMVADWATTRYGAKHNFPNGTYETNIVLGRYPSTDRVDLYFVGLLVSNYYIADNFNPDTRTFYLSMRTVLHGFAAKHNVMLGWQLQF